MPADQGLIDSVANENTKVGAGGPAHWAAAGMKAHADYAAAQAAHLTRLNIIAETALSNALMISQAATGSIVKSLTELDAVEAMGNAVVGQQGAKVAQSTPPVTP